MIPSQYGMIVQRRSSVTRSASHAVPSLVKDVNIGIGTASKQRRGDNRSSNATANDRHSMVYCRHDAGAGQAVDHSHIFGI